MPQTIATGNVRVVGKCGICGGRVTVPTVFWSVVPPKPTCESCGAVVDETAFLPTLPMRPRRRRGCPYCGCIGKHYCTGGQSAHPGWKLRKHNAGNPLR